jgi:hypothetical protein
MGLITFNTGLITADKNGQKKRRESFNKFRTGLRANYNPAMVMTVLSEIQFYMLRQNRALFLRFWIWHPR